MRWLAKAAVQRVLGTVPGGEAVNHQLSRRVSGYYPIDGARVRLHFEAALGHVRAFERHGTKPLADAHVYEYGAGWNLLGPLAMWSLGAQRQTVVDIRSLLRFDLVEDVLARLEEMHDELSQLAGRELRRSTQRRLADTGQLEHVYGIRYRAPSDARATGLAAGSVDLASSTFTLEHIPAADIPAIHRETRRILAPGGVTSHDVDCEDHYSFMDASLSSYNFLRYSDPAWAVLDSPLQSQNRLRTVDHLRLLRDAGFTVLEATENQPTPEQRAGLERLRLAARFRDGYTIDELAPLTLEVVATAP